jgi:predicted nucleic acid-binding protein
MAAGRRIYLDANIFIETFEGTGVRSASLLRLLLSRVSSRPSLVTSELTLAEVLVGAYRNRDDVLVDTYFTWMSENPAIEVAAVSRAALVGAALLRADHRSLKLADAIHIAIAIDANCSALMTADGGLMGTYKLVDRNAGMASAPIEIVRPEIAYLDGLAAGGGA